jgi:hypothetical protein
MTGDERWPFIQPCTAAWMTRALSDVSRSEGVKLSNRVDQPPAA